jgi:predicted O-methyltransferase YrrM
MRVRDDHRRPRRVDLRGLAWKALRHATGVGDLRLLRRLVPSTPEPTRDLVELLLDELLHSPELAGSLEGQAARQWSGMPADLGGAERLAARVALDGAGRGRALLLYVAVRLARPDVVVETGCFTGWDSAVLLQALHRNGHGQLHSIDLPAVEGRFSQRGPRSGLPPETPIGFLVPEALKGRWSLTVGDVRDHLGGLLEDLGDIGLFYHDSDHGYEHMLWEYATAWPHLRSGGLLVSDDIAWNPAMWDFARRVGRHPVIHRRAPNLGAIVR